jgi:hypothetical protein
MLNKLVIKEAKNLLKFAKKAELEKLELSKLNPKDHLGCIYGQIANGCFSDRATTLIKQSCERVFNVDTQKNNSLVRPKLNGSPLNMSRGQFWSPIEVFIYMKKNQKNGNNERLVKFLKGETKTLRFK